MLDYNQIKMIKSTVSKKGLKMWFYYSDGADRWIRLKKADAEILKASEQVDDVTGMDLLI